MISCNLRRWCVFCHVRLFLVQVFIDNLRGLVEPPTYHLYYIFTYKLFMFVNHFFGYNNLFETCFSQNANQSCCIQELFVIPSQAINDVFFYSAAKTRVFSSVLCSLMAWWFKGGKHPKPHGMLSLVKVHETSSKQQKNPCLWVPLGIFIVQKFLQVETSWRWFKMIQNDQFHWLKLKKTLENDMKFTQ